MVAVGRCLRHTADARPVSRGEGMTAATSESLAIRLHAAIRGRVEVSLRRLVTYTNCESPTTVRHWDVVDGRGRGGRVTTSIRRAFQSRESVSRERAEIGRRSKAGRLLSPLSVGTTAVSTASQVGVALSRNNSVVVVIGAFESAKAFTRQNDVL